MLKRLSIEVLKADKMNANKGTQEGANLLQQSLQQYGAGRSILLDRNDQVIAGNKTLENAKVAGYKNVIIVETTGDEIVAVKRMDVDLDSKAGRELAIADNKTAEVNLSWDNEMLNSLSADFDIDLSGLGFIEDSSFSLNIPEREDEEISDGSHMETDFKEQQYSENLFPLSITLTKAQRLNWDNWKKANKYKGDTEAFLFIFKRIQQI